MSTPAAPGQVRFGVFHCDFAAGELHKKGVKIRIADQPLRLLAILLERPGEMVSRQEITGRLWGSGTFVDFDDGLNTCVNKLRVALDDRAENPKFIETIPRRGYRFIGEVLQPAILGPPPAVANQPAEIQRQPGSRRTARWPWAAVMVAALALAWWGFPLPPPEVTSIDQITTTSRIDTPLRPISDGTRVYYIERDGDHWDLMQTSVRGGVPARVAAPGPSADIFDVSRRTGQLLLGSFTARDAGRQLWTMPLQGGAPVRISSVSDIGEAIFSPDGSQILYRRGATLWLMQPDGGNPRTLVTLPEAAEWLAWSPGGHRIRFNFEHGIGEIAADGGGFHRVGLPPGLGACCGTWTSDGRYFIFTGTRDGKANIYALRERGSTWRRSPRGPFQLTYGPDQPAQGAPGPAGRHIFFYNGIGRTQAEVANPNTGNFRPMPGAHFDTYSRDRSWIAYLDPVSGALIRSRPNGANSMVLVGADYNPSFPRWSPDGNWIAFQGGLAGKPSSGFLVSNRGGPVAPLLQDGRDEGDVDWSPDGRTLVLSRATDPRDRSQRDIELVNFQTRQATAIPGSQNLEATRWSPDGRFISATSVDQHQLKVWSLTRRLWQVIARGTAFGIAEWSPDSRYLYFQDLLAPGEPLFRYTPATERVTKVADFTLPLEAGAYRCAFWGISPAGDPIMQFDRSGEDLFSATVRLP